MSTYRTPPQCRWAGSARRGGIDQFPQCTARARALEAWSTLRLSFSLGTHFVRNRRAYWLGSSLVSFEPRRLAGPSVLKHAGVFARSKISGSLLAPGRATADLADVSGSR